MALTSEILWGSGVELPTGFTPTPAALTLVDPADEAMEITVASSGVVNVDPVVGIAALGTAVKAAIDGTDLPALGVDTVGNTIEAQYTIAKVVRDFGASEYSTTDNFICSVRSNWAKI